MSAFPATLPAVDLLINSTTEFGQEFFSGSQKSTVTALADGRFLVTFVDTGDPGNPGALNTHDIRVRVFNADGSAAGPDFVANTTVAGAQDFPAATALADGGFIVTWNDQTHLPDIDPLNGVRGQRFDANGVPVGTEFIIPDIRTDLQSLASVEVLSNGDLVYVWQHSGGGTDDTSNTGIRARIVTLTGAVIKADFQINNFTDGAQGGPHVLSLREGGFMVAFTDRSVNTGTGEGEISVRFFENDGTPVASQFRVNTTTTDTQTRPQAAQLENGNIVLTWFDAGTFDLSGRIITPDGTPVTNEFAINTTTAGTQFGVKVTALQDGHFMAVWGDDGVGDGSAGAVRGQIFSATGQKVGGEVILNSITTDVQNNPSVATLADGRVMVVWMDRSNTAPDTSVSAIRGKIIDTRTSAVDLDGTALDDEWFGTAFNDTMRGNAGNDTLHGAAGNDSLDGGAGSDSMIGGAGNDTYVVNQTGDRVVEAAGGGTDTVRSSASHSLAANVENLILTGTANLNGTGNSAANRLTGNAGANRIDGRGGADTMVGGAGNDTYTVDRTGDRVVEAASGGIDTVRAGASFTLSNHVERLILTGTANLNGTGNGAANTLIGNAGANTLVAGGGNDRLSGGAGADVLKGGMGRDSLGGGRGADRLEGNAGNDLLSGHGANDVLLGGAGRDRLLGGAGADLLMGGIGTDQLTGGTGADTFRFRTAAEAGTGRARDVITDFQTGRDKIDLSRLLDDGAFIGAAAFSGTAGELRYLAGRGILIGDVNGDGRGDFQIRLLNTPALDADDFLF